MNSLSKKIYLELPKPKTGDVVADQERLLRELKKEFGKTELSYGVLRRDYRNFRSEDWKVTATLLWNGEHWEVSMIESGDTRKSHYALAVDLGSTMIAMALLDMNSGETIAEEGAPNPQIKIGTEILSRIFYGKDDEEHLRELQQYVISAFDHLMTALSEKTGIDCKNTTVMVVGGNTTMVHLLLGIDAFSIFMTPFAPVLNHTGYLNPQELGLSTNAMVYCIPSIANYLGGDIISGILAVDMLKEDRLCLYMDIGTNGEMVIGNKEFMFAGAGAAGPALEGGVSKYGMRAEEGAVSGVSIEKGVLKISVIGGGKAKGICGSGIVDLLSVMLINGWMDKQGKLNDGMSSRIAMVNGEKALIYATAEEGENGEPRYFTEGDIAAFREIKSAAYTMVACLLEAAEVEIESVDVIYAAGGFGQYINVESAIDIGMYPDVPLDRFQVVGNGSLKGAYKMLTQREYMETLKDVTENIYYLEFGTFKNFIHMMQAATFFPHTELQRYPTVMAKLAKLKK